MKRFISAFILFSWSIGVFATISTQVTPSKIQLGSMFHLVFTLDTPQTRVPDLTPLQQDFTIIGTERSSSYSVVNGQTHSVNQWMVLLSPKRTGILPIPSIQIGREQSTASRVEVIQGSVSPKSQPQASQTGEGLKLKTELSVKDPFVNQQLVYTVKLYNSQRLMDAEYHPPRVEDALLVPLGDSRRYQTNEDGRTYAVEEQQYAIFPQKEGTLTILPPSFSALIFDAVPRHINVEGKTRRLVVKPIPKRYSGKYWLPATQLSLTERYDETQTKLKQGSTLVRTVTLQAAGVPAQLLPTLEFGGQTEFNAYPEKPELTNTARLKELIGRAEVKVTYLLNKAGRVTIPELQISWFNTMTGKEELALLPARTIEVDGGVGSSQPTSEVATESKASSPLPPFSPLRTQKSPPLAWILAILFALLWILTLILWYCLKHKSGQVQNIKSALKALRQACHNNDAPKAQVALLDWATLKWPDVSFLNLQQVAEFIHDVALKKEISGLLKALYGQKKTSAWQGDGLWQSVVAYHDQKPISKHHHGRLPPINP